MVPFADQINHENVCTNYDCLDPETGETLMTQEQVEQKRREEERKKEEEQKQFLNNLRQDLEDLGEQVKQK